MKKEIILGILLIGLGAATPVARAQTDNASSLVVRSGGTVTVIHPEDSLDDTAVHDPADDPAVQKKIREIKDFVLGFGPLAFWVYVILYALNTITLIPPILFMTLSGGAIFGPFWGALGIFLGCIFGTTMTFFISRFLGRRFVERIIKGRAREFEEKLNQKGFLTILVFRLVAFPPWEVLNYTAGLTKIKYKDFILGTALGIIPSIIVQVFLADRAVNIDFKNPVVIAQLIAAVAAFILLGQLPTLYKKFKRSQQRG